MLFWLGRFAILKTQNTLVDYKYRGNIGAPTGQIKNFAIYLAIIGGKTWGNGDVYCYTTMWAFQLFNQESNLLSVSAGVV